MPVAEPGRDGHSDSSGPIAGRSLPKAANAFWMASNAGRGEFPPPGLAALASVGVEEPAACRDVSGLEIENLGAPAAGQRQGQDDGAALSPAGVSGVTVRSLLISAALNPLGGLWEILGRSSWSQGLAWTMLILMRKR